MDFTNIDYLGIDRVLKRGTGEILETGAAPLIRDTVSGAYLLGSNNAELSIPLLDRYAETFDLLMIPDLALGRLVFERYGFAGKLECYQVAYYGVAPAVSSSLSVRVADRGDLPLLLENYHHISPQEMELVVERGSLLLGYLGERIVGFIGEHLEGSMGLLYIFPEFRRRGFGAELEKLYIRKTMEKGFLPFGQVAKDNLASLELQKKLGMTVSENLICWMWMKGE